MKKYNLVTGEYIEEESICDYCGEPINSLEGIRICYIKDKNNNRKKVVSGSCCTGKINAYNSLSKNLREKYRSQGQMSEDFLSKSLPLAPKPDAKSDTAGKEVHKFIDGILKEKGRSKLTKSYEGKLKYKRNKSLKD